jgi:hypothetical protein
MSIRRGLLAVVLTAGLVDCRPRPPAPEAIRLTDLYRPDTVEGRFPVAATRPRTEWRFDGPAEASSPAARGWEVAGGIGGLAVRDGRLQGRSTTAFPVLHVERHPAADDREAVHAFEIRARVSAGTTLAVTSRESDRVDLKDVVDPTDIFNWRTTAPLVAGTEMRTYTLRPAFPVSARELRHLFVRPTDAAGATFEIESVRVVFSREHLAGRPSGVSWEGLSETYRESLVARAPETIHFHVRVPPRPRLDLAVGTPEDGAVTFRVGLGDAGGGERTLLEKTVTRANRWEDVTVDLADLAERDVSLSLSVRADTPGTIGLWGAPTLRSRAAVATDTGVPGGRRLRGG